MKHLTTYDKFILSEAINEKMTVNDIKDKYLNNPYGIGADAIEYIESPTGDNVLVLKFEDSYGRKQAEKELRSLGIPAKKMSNSTQDKAYKYRYELNLFENEIVNESLRDASEHLDAVTKALPDLEKLIFNASKVKVKLKVKAEDTRSGIILRIYSDDLTNILSPLGKTAFSAINISTWGGIENQDGNIWFTPKLSYEHPSGGSNGTDFIWSAIWFDPNTNKWIEGRKLLK